jgi:hypothetical protein
MAQGVVRHADRVARDWVRESVNEIAASMASRLASSREGACGVYIDDQEALAANETGRVYEGGPLNERSAPKAVTLQVPRESLPDGKWSADDYREKADACLKWAREAPTDEVRLACLNLAQAWLIAAMREDGGASDALPLAPTL